MFLAWKEIKRNKLKFSLIIGVLVLISYLLFLLSGLAKGLINMNTEGIDDWQADAIVLNKNANETIQQSKFNVSLVDDKFKESARLKQTVVIVSNNDKEENAIFFGTEENSFLVPKIIEGETPQHENEVLIDKSLKEKGFKVGDNLELTQVDEVLKVVGVTESAKFNASPVIFGDFDTFLKINPMLSEGETNAVVVKDKDFNDVKLDNDLEVLAIEDFIEELPGYKEQNLTLNFMIGFLFVISMTVIGVFLYVITLQKINLFGVLKAQGFTNGDLAKVMISQTFILSAIGTIIGLIFTLITALVLPDIVPIKFEYSTLALYGAILIVVSLLGSLFSIFTIRNIDPLEAIG